MERKVDNPWLLWFLPLYLAFAGAVVGWVFGPIFFRPKDDQNPGLDLYSRGNFDGSQTGAMIVALGGLVLGILVASFLRSFPKKDETQLPSLQFDEHH
jgi:NADH:ubiquinone oxidoreductase subunit 5 (subunit L)/multisubunit Na+/H+ antiporter MnhA subunit